MADCDCSATSLQINKILMKNNVTPTIPESLIVYPGGESVKIKFEYGYDTVSCNCGAGDCISYCDSVNDMVPVFTDTIAKKTVTLPHGVYSWSNQNLVIQASSDETQTEHSLEVSLTLGSNPSVEGRKYTVPVTVQVPKTLEALTTVASGVAGATSEFNLRSLINPSEDDVIVLEQSVSNRVENIKIRFEDYTMIIESSKESDAGSYEV